jgi:hypothetical protein
LNASEQGAAEAGGRVGLLGYDFPVLGKFDGLEFCESAGVTVAGH